MVIEVEVPSAVYAVDLRRLSNLLQIPENELVQSFQARPHISEMHGVIVDAGQDVPFETVNAQEEDMAASEGLMQPFGTPMGIPRAYPPDTQQRVHQVLLTAAARPSALDSDDLPKCLIQLGTMPILGHILTQLHAAGMERVVISVAAGGDKIIAAVKQFGFQHKMKIEFLNLGPKNVIGHARSILAARRCFENDEPFLIHTADHIFDKTLISKFANFSLADAAACVLVETDVSDLVGLPPTAVRVQLQNGTVTQIGRDLAHYDGLDAGLFMCSTEIFDSLQFLASKQDYFSLADALNRFTKSNRLVYVSTGGESWFSIETEEQLAYTKDSDGVSVLSPWTVFLASTRQVLEDSSAKKSVVIGVSGAQDTSLRVAGHADGGRVFDGFVIGLSSGLPHQNSMPVSGHDVQVKVDDTTPLLSSGSKPAQPSPAQSTQSGYDPYAEPTYEEPYVLSIPVDEMNSRAFDEISSSNHHALLIELNQTPITPVRAQSQYVLAVSGKEGSPRARPEMTLPSDITNISLETRGYDENLEITLVVERRAPIIGYVLLCSSVITIASVGVALDIEQDVSNALLKPFWRQTATFALSLPIALWSIRKHGRSPFQDMETSMNMLIAGLSYSFFLGCFVLSLAFTSVGHATLFNNAHSLLIVFIKLIFGQPIIPFEGIGAGVGVLGGAVTSMDSSGSDGDAVPPGALGDFIALVGALGGASYFIHAKKVRPKMDLVVYLASLTGISAFVMLFTMMIIGPPVELSTDRNNGLFGWLNFTGDRLGVEMYLVLICDFVGTMGYVSVLKYFDPIVISVACLLEPIGANIIGIIFGVDSIPGLLTVVGSLLVTGGTFMVISTQRSKTEEIDATEAIQSTRASDTPALTPLYSARSRRGRGSKASRRGRTTSR